MSMRGKRRALFNEMKATNMNAEKLKEILGGENTEVPVKFGPPAKLGKIPCILTTNNDPFESVLGDGTSRDALYNRTSMHQWRRIQWDIRVAMQQ